MPNVRLEKTRAVYRCAHDACLMLTPTLLQCQACGELVTTPDLRAQLLEAQRIVLSPRPN